MPIKQGETILQREGYDKLWLWFGLSHAAFAIMTRVLMHEMPDEWQGKMADLLKEYDETFDTSDVCQYTEVHLYDKNNTQMEAPEALLNYRRPNRAFIQECKRMVINECFESI